MNAIVPMPVESLLQLLCTVNHLLNDGETASYYIFIQYKDGRESEHSNTASVSAN